MDFSLKNEIENIKKDIKGNSLIFHFYNRFNLDEGFR